MAERTRTPLEPAAPAVTATADPSSTTALVELARRHLAQALPRATELVFARGEGCWLWTRDGDRYFDFVSGIAVNQLGHCPPEVVEAVRDQVGRLIHTCFVSGYYEPTVRLAHKLAQIAPEPLDTVFFSMSGAEAIDGAVKLARQATRRPAVLAFRGAFHGRTLTAVALTASSVKYRRHYEPLLPSVYHVNYPYCYRCPYGIRNPERCDLECLREIRRLFDTELHPDDLGAIVAEPIQGEGGYVPAPRRWLEGLRALCDQHGILLVLDEVQTGFGRTGTWFACQQAGVTPDVMCLGKGIASGFPLSAVVASRALHDRWPQGSHGTTFGGHPVSAAAALASIEAIEAQGLVQRAQKLGAWFTARLRELQERYPIIGDVRGPGLMIGLELVKPGTGKGGAADAPNPEACRKLLHYALVDEKVLFYACGIWSQCVRFMPPLNIAVDDLEEGLARFERVLARVAAEET